MVNPSKNINNLPEEQRNALVKIQDNAVHIDSKDLIQFVEDAEASKNPFVNSKLFEFWFVNKYKSLVKI